MPMKNSTKIVKVLLTNIPIAACISLVASYIGISSAGVPEEAFMPAFLSTAAINIVVAYVISFFIGWFIPAEKIARNLMNDPAPDMRYPRGDHPRAAGAAQARHKSAPGVRGRPGRERPCEPLGGYATCGLALSEKSASTRQTAMQP